MVLPPYPRVARHAATAVVAIRLHSHHLVIHTSVYLSSRSYHSSLHSCTCMTHSVDLVHLFRFHSPTSLASIYPLTRAPFAHMSRPRGRTDKSPPIIRMRKDGVTSVPPSGSACCDCRGRYSLHPHRLVIHASVYLPLAPITQVSTHAHASHSLTSFIHIRIDLT